MVKTFEKPPLVELIAELRWIPGGVKVAQNDPNALEIQPSLFLSPRHDELYMRFAQLIAQHGYTQIERLIPVGMPSLPFTPAYRYREGGSPQGPTVYQLGVGIFSANTTPPYQSWDAFRPVAERGVQMLREALGEKGAPPAFNSVVLRYIDAFTNAFTQGRGLERFLREVLGIEVRVPDAITRQRAVDKEIQPRIQLGIPLRSGMHMQLSLADGRVGSDDAIIMDTAISAGTPISGTVTEVMAALDSAHTVIHDTFVDLTIGLHSVMKPVKD